MRGAQAAGGALEEVTEAVLEVALSADSKGETLVVLRGSGGLVYLDDADFQKLRLPLPRTAALTRAGRSYHAPAALPGCSVAVDEARQRAVISVSIDSLETTRVSAAARSHPLVTPASPGAFLNYQLSAQQISGHTNGGVFGELGLFAGPGVVTATGVSRTLGIQGQSGREIETVRLDTVLTQDFPDRLETVNVGDAISDPASWGNAVRFAGIRFSRNFGLRPDLLTTPLLSTGGMATVPSTADVFVNNQLVSTSQIPPGPFIIDRLPTVSGTGDVSVVVRDALGREQMMSQTFYSSTVLLARDLTQYSINLGSERQLYALQSNRYRGTLGEFSYRRGMTDHLTLEGHAEYLSGEAQAGGVNAGFGIGHLGVINLTAAGGGDAHGTGFLGGMGVEHRGVNTSVVASSLWTSRDFAQVGEPTNPNLRMRQRHLLQTGVGLGRFGSLSFAYVRQSYRNSPAQQTLGLTQSLSLGRSGTVNLTVSHTRVAQGFYGFSVTASTTAAQESTSLYVIYVFPFGARSAASATAVSGSGPGALDREVLATLSESPPAGPGSGYRLSAATSGNYDADWRQQTAAADVELELASNQHVDGRSALLSGALTFLDGQVRTTRTVNGSFAMVDVAGLPDVPVYVENQLTTHTDATGRALIYNLRSYEANRISIAPEELPLDTAIASSSSIMTPPYRSGVVARFPVERIRSGTFRLVTEEGVALPVGASVTLQGKAFPVVLDGMVYVTGYDHGIDGAATFRGGRCTFRLPSPPADEPLPELGTIQCRQ